LNISWGIEEIENKLYYLFCIKAADGLDYVQQREVESLILDYCDLLNERTKLRSND
jgi:hypothetical protein